MLTIATSCLFIIALAKFGHVRGSSCLKKALGDASTLKTDPDASVWENFNTAHWILMEKSSTTDKRPDPIKHSTIMDCVGTEFKPEWDRRPFLFRHFVKIPDASGCKDKYTNFVQLNEALIFPSLQFEQLLESWDKVETYSTCIDQQSQRGKYVGILQLILQNPSMQPKLTSGHYNAMSDLINQVFRAPQDSLPFQYYSIMFDIKAGAARLSNEKAPFGLLRDGYEKLKLSKREANQYMFAEKFTRQLFRQESYPLSQEIKARLIDGERDSKALRQLANDLHIGEMPRLNITDVPGVMQLCGTNQKLKNHCESIVRTINDPTIVTWDQLEKSMDRIQEESLAKFETMARSQNKALISVITIYVKMYSKFAQGHFLESFEYFLLATQLVDSSTSMFYLKFEEFQKAIMNQILGILETFKDQSVQELSSSVNDRFITERDRFRRAEKELETKAARIESQKKEQEEIKKKNADYILKTEGTRQQKPQNTDTNPPLDLGELPKDQMDQEKANFEGSLKNAKWQDTAQLFAKLDYFLYDRLSIHTSETLFETIVKPYREDIKTQAKSAKLSMLSAIFGWMEPGITKQLLYNITCIQDLKTTNNSTDNEKALIAKAYNCAAGGEGLVDVRDDCSKALAASHILVKAKFYDVAKNLLVGACPCDAGLSSTSNISPNCLKKAAGTIYAFMSEGEQKFILNQDYLTQYSNALEIALLYYGNSQGLASFVRHDFMAAVAQLVSSWNAISPKDGKAPQYLETPNRKFAFTKVTTTDSHDGKTILAHIEGNYETVKKQIGKLEGRALDNVTALGKFGHQLTYEHAKLKARMRQFVDALDDWRLGFSSRHSPKDRLGIRLEYEKFLKQLRDDCERGLPKMAEMVDKENPTGSLYKKVPENLVKKKINDTALVFGGTAAQNVKNPVLNPAKTGVTAMNQINIDFKTCTEAQLKAFFDRSKKAEEVLKNESVENLNNLFENKHLTNYWKTFVPSTLDLSSIALNKLSPYLLLNRHKSPSEHQLFSIFGIKDSNISAGVKKQVLSAVNLHREHSKLSSTSKLEKIRKAYIPLVVQTDWLIPDIVSQPIYMRLKRYLEEMAEHTTGTT